MGEATATGRWFYGTQEDSCPPQGVVWEITFRARQLQRTVSMATATHKAPTKSEVIQNIAQSSELSRKQVSSVLEGLAGEMKKALGKKGSGLFVVPGLMKVTVIQKPAVAARKGINPFTKMEQMFKARPARKVVKVRPLKNLKDMAK
jgi:nucleoid DNA-binding protein